MFGWGSAGVLLLPLPLALGALHQEARESRNGAEKGFFFPASGISEPDIVILLLEEEKHSIPRPRTSEEQHADPSLFHPVLGGLPGDFIRTYKSRARSARL